jgi:hypothetical protein
VHNSTLFEHRSFFRLHNFALSTTLGEPFTPTSAPLMRHPLIQKCNLHSFDEQTSHSFFPRELEMFAHLGPSTLVRQSHYHRPLFTPSGTQPPTHPLTHSTAPHWSSGAFSPCRTTCNTPLAFAQIDGGNHQCTTMPAATTTLHSFTRTGAFVHSFIHAFKRSSIGFRGYVFTSAIHPFFLSLPQPVITCT